MNRLAGLCAAGALPGLVELAAEEEVHAKCQAVSAMRLLANHATNRDMIVQLGVLPFLADAASNKYDLLELKREVAGLICNLALSDANKLPIAQSPCVTPLVTLAQSPIDWVTTPPTSR